MNKTEEMFLDIIKWYDYHKSPNMPLEQKVKFLEDMQDNMFTLMTMMYKDMKKGDHMSEPKIVLPAGIKLHDRVRA